MGPQWVRGCARASFTTKTAVGTPNLNTWRPTPFLNTYLAGPKPPRASSTLQYTLFNLSYLLYVKVRPIGSLAPYRYPIAPYRYPRDPSGQAAYSVLPLGSLDFTPALRGLSFEVRGAGLLIFKFNGVFPWSPGMFPSRLRRLCRRSFRPDVPRVAQRPLLRRRKAAEVELLALLSDRHRVLALLCLHALEARFVARRRHQHEAFGHRGARPP